MVGSSWFYRNPEDWQALVQRLKLLACPHCDVVGMLIRHGRWFGFDETSPRRKVLRGQRLLCSNRNARQGCGRTVSVWLADKIRRLSLTVGGLWKFLKATVARRMAAAIREMNGPPPSDRTLARIWRRFNLAQSRIRTALSERCSPPGASAEPSRRPAAAQVLAHLHAAFPNADCPIAPFQWSLRAFFI